MQITLVLALRIDPDRLVSDLDRFIAIGLPSIKHFLSHGLVHELLVITPGENLAECRTALAGDAALPVRVIDEGLICPSIANSRGWYKQQALKLAVAGHIHTDWYLTLDADVLCTRPVTEDFLFHEGKAIWQKEPAEYHRKWWDGSRQVLGGDLDIADEQPVIGVTPALLHAPSVLGLIAFLTQKYPDKDWAVALLDMHQLRWSEYSLYWVYLLMRGETGKFYSDSEKIPYAKASLWSAEQLRALAPGMLDELFSHDAPHGFMVFQSNLEQSLASTVRLLRPRLGGSATPTMRERYRWSFHALRFQLRKVPRMIGIR